MNIFVVNNDPVCAAQELCDKHVVKMIVESGQMLSTAHRVLDGVEYYSMSKGTRPRKIKRWHLNDARERILWKASFVNHPCTLWTMATDGNYQWHANHAYALCKEYSRRYGKIHSSEILIEYLNYNLPKNIKSGELTPFAQAMPDKYKSADAVTSYRSYYNGEKTKFAVWNYTETPDWYEGSTV